MVYRGRPTGDLTWVCPCSHDHLELTAGCSAYSIGPLFSITRVDIKLLQTKDVCAKRDRAVPPPLTPHKVSKLAGLDRPVLISRRLYQVLAVLGLFTAEHFAAAHFAAAHFAAG